FIKLSLLNQIKEGTMEKKREIYEQRSEILTKKLLSKIYAMEASYLESRMKAKKNMDQVSEHMKDWEQQLKNLDEERKKLNQLYQDMIGSTQAKWEEASAAFEEYAEQVNAEKQDFYERTQGWMDDFGAWISDLEERARHSSGQFRDQLNHQVEYLKNQQTSLGKRMGELQKNTGENWDKVTTSINNEVRSMRSSINKAYQSLLSSGSREKDEAQPESEQ
ncbi:MAG: hypothetical protein KGY60_12980, partial [Bacteroidales bacterium]|nr:hypothetical protein [Bacteroidales bacterium]